MPARFVDREATETRLLGWAQESDRVLHGDWTVRQLQLDPTALDRIVDDYGVGLMRRISSSHEFSGSQEVREGGARTIRNNWPELRLAVRRKAAAFYESELVTAVALTPKAASLVLNPNALGVVLNSPGGTVDLGRWGATAKPGQRVGGIVIVNADNSAVRFTLVDRPTWIYTIGADALIRDHDPFFTDVVRRVHDSTRWIQSIMPFLLKAAAFGIGMSGSVALVITGILLEEFAEELQADAEGRSGRSIVEIMQSAGTQFLVDRIFHGLVGGGTGRAAAGVGGAVTGVGGRHATRLARVADRAVPVIKRELVAAESPLVREAMEAGKARHVVDDAIRAEGHTVEVAVESAGQRHVFRLNEKTGLWCRFSDPVCHLNLGADVLAAAASPKSYTAAKLEDTRAIMTAVQDEIQFLGDVYGRMRRAGKVDLRLLSKDERALLNQLSPSGDAATLSMRGLRDLPKTLRLGGDFAAAATEEARLVQQLYREGRPLYEIMRAASPSHASRAKVLAEWGGRDAASGMPPRSGVFAIDHVVPLNEIIAMKGFADLRPERQLQIVNDVRNLRVIDAAANSSRGDRSWWVWGQGLIHYDAMAMSKMRALEDEMRALLQSEITRLSRL